MKIESSTRSGGSFGGRMFARSEPRETPQGEDRPRVSWWAPWTWFGDGPQDMSREDAEDEPCWW